ncbi:hypothetical protein SAMN05444401_3569 [Clostridium amylolyticum]|uniref:Uncharacterized protein n=1 Tax=Clostridium amylolyticum TaxID=1121298 RepID=A0A1M6L135_9CLOT|nr:hypothetical protein [Clostridium amylolyticum]SHJ64917.1 hypothetical protein SAMN05444401_3569 [Clostridium amylolyticum]
MLADVNKTKEYSFQQAWKMLNKGDVMTSKDTGYSYKIDKSDKRNKLKFYNPVIAWWQECDYVLTKEIFGLWYTQF